MRVFVRYVLPVMIIMVCAMIISGFMAVQHIQKSLEPTPDEVRYHDAMTALATCQRSLKDCT